MNELIKIAKEFFVSIIVISELKYDFGVDDFCLTSTIKSSAIEQYADTILFMTENEKGEKELVVRKGDEDKIGLRFNIDSSLI